jgi:pimeloyl-ACP methyl ester carboxylesterase
VFKNIVFLLSIIYASGSEAKNYIFLNGGPGLNSQPEKYILGPHLESLGHKAFFWNEPSSLRPTEDTFNPANAYHSAVISAKNFIDDVCQNSTDKDCDLTLITHSFSVHYAIELITKYHAPIKELVLISPALNIHVADKNILKLASNGLEIEGDASTSQEISELLPKLIEEFNQDKIEAFILASKYTSLFTNYWANLELMANYFSYLVNEYSFTAQEMMLVRISMPRTQDILEEKISIPTKIFFCEEDPVTIHVEQVTKIQNYFLKPEIKVLDNCKHYPHLEQMKKIFF